MEKKNLKLSAISIKILCRITGSIIVIATLLLSGCALNEVYDKSVPPEKLCALKIPNNITVKEIDGKSVSWGFHLGYLNLQIPEGHHTFLADAQIQGHCTTVGGTARNGQPINQTRCEVYNASNIGYAYNFKAGETYIMDAEMWGNNMNISIAKENTK
jgi:hypothetical protein